MKSVRSAARALIVHHGELLTITMRRGRGQLFHILPGGGQRHGETLHQTLLRECREEIGLEPIVGPIAYVREYIGRNHGFRQAHREFHQIEVVFRCQLAPGATPAAGHEADKHQVGLAWIPLGQLPEVEFYPACLKEHIRQNDIRVDPLYLGDIN